MTLSEAPPETAHDDGRLADLRTRLDSVLAVGLFSSLDEYVVHCAQVEVIVRREAEDLAYSPASVTEQVYPASSLGSIYSAAHIEGFAREIGILRDASPADWRELPLYQLVTLTDESLLKAKTTREQIQAQRYQGSGENQVREHYRSQSQGSRSVRQ